MDMTDHIEQLTALLDNIAEQHHKAFVSTNGNDPMWALLCLILPASAKVFLDSSPKL